VLIDFRTYTCINCLRTLPYLEAWDARYRGAGLTIVGVHTPEFSFERDAGNVGSAIRQLGIRYPVVQDNARATWNAWGNQYWPAEYLIDAQGHVREAHFGEGEYARTEAAIRTLLGAGGAGAHPVGAISPSDRTTPETYLGPARAEGWVPRSPLLGTHAYAPVRRLALNEFAFGGTWTVTTEHATAGARATIDAEVQAKDIYMVLSPPPHGAGSVRVLLDGRAAGSPIVVRRQRLYTLAALSRPQHHRLTLQLSPGTRGYSFTFG
jgi:thiol-disulfide isomerase/thioredoxin